MHEKDREAVLKGGPWSFDKALLMLKDPGYVQSSQLEFKETQFWVRAYDIPVIAMNMAIAKIIGDVFGRALELDEEQVMLSAKYLRVRVMVDVTKPLRRGIIMVFGKTKVWVELKYERLPNFCCTCGWLGHVEIDCEEDNIEQGQQFYGDSLRASPLKRINERDMLEKEKAKAWRFNYKAREKEKHKEKPQRRLLDILNDGGEESEVQHSEAAVRWLKSGSQVLDILGIMVGRRMSLYMKGWIMLLQTSRGLSPTRGLWWSIYVGKVLIMFQFLFIHFV